MDVFGFYTGILKAAGLSVNDNNEVIIEMSDTKTKLTIDGQRLMLPSKELLVAGLKDDMVAFHPACEGIARKESAVLKRFRKAIQYRLNWVLAELLSQLMDIAADTSRHAKLSPDQSEYLSIMANADQKTLTALDKIITKMDLDKVERRLVSVFIKRPGLLNGKEYPRVAVVTFPILNSIMSNDENIFEFKRQKDKNSVVSLFLSVLPNADQLGEYSFGTSDMVAPNLYSLLMSVASIFEKINDKVALFENQLNDPEELKTDLSFIAGMESLAKYRALIPELRGNTGDKLDGVADEDELVNNQPSAPVEKKRVQIGYPAPDKARPQQPAVSQQPQQHTQLPTSNREYQNRAYPNEQVRQVPEATQSASTPRTWRDLVPPPQPQQHPANGYPGHIPPPQQQNFYAPPAPQQQQYYGPPPTQAPQQYYGAPPQQYYGAPQPQQYYGNYGGGNPAPQGGSPGRERANMERAAMYQQRYYGNQPPQPQQYYGAPPQQPPQYYSNQPQQTYGAPPQNQQFFGYPNK